MKKMIMCLMVASLLLTNTAVIQAKDTKDMSEQKTVNKMTSEARNSDKSTNNSEFEEDFDSVFDSEGTSDEISVDNVPFEEDMFDFTVSVFKQTERREFVLEKAMPENDYNEFSGTKNVQIEAGENFTIVLKENGTVWSWGNNKYGQLGNGTTVQSGVPQKVKELSNIVYINAGATFAFAINNRGEVFAWGDNRYAQLGDGTVTGRTKPVRTSQITDIKKISAGYYHTVALRNDGTVYFWGNPKMNPNVQGYEFERIPIEVDIQNIQNISSGKSHIIALSEEGEIYTWGENESGQLGNGVVGNRVTSPQKVELSVNITKIEAGMEYNVALDDSGHVYAWGSNLYGQLGDGTNEDKCSPVRLESINNIKDVIAGYNHTIFIKDNDGIYLCGNNEYGQLGVGTTENSNLPIKISSQCEPISISGGLSHTVEIDAEGNTYVWGLNSSRQLGNSDNIPINTSLKPTEVYGLENIVSIENGLYHSLALDKDGIVWSWGHNSHNQLGDGTTIDRETPKKIIEDVKSISAGHYHSVALKNDGTVWSWGFNGFAQIGQDENKNYSPIQVQGLTDIIAIAAGSYHNLALKNDGTVWMWGRKNYQSEQSGVNNHIRTPIQIEGLTNIKSIEAGFYTNFAVKEDGTVYAWGINGHGQFGDGTKNDSETPVKAIVQNIKSVSAGKYHTIMIGEDGEVFGFGYNNDYQYGDINENRLTNIESAAVGHDYSLMLTKDGRVLACGYNYYGELGNGTNKRNVVPVEIEGLSNIKDIAACAGRHSVALKNDGTVVAWGNNGSGQLGTGKKFTFKNPCLIGSFGNGKYIGVGGNLSGSIRHIFGQDWYKFNVPYDAIYRMSVTQGYEFEVYQNGILQNIQPENSFELKSKDDIYIRIMRKDAMNENYILSITSNKIVNTIYKKDLVTVDDSEYYINLYDNRYLYKDDIKLTNYPVNSIYNNGNALFVAGEVGIDSVVGTTVTTIVSGVKASFIAADAKNIYFSNGFDGNKIYYSKIGSNRCYKLNDDAGIFLEVDDTYLYYYDVKNHCNWTKIKKIQ